jgi:hypothetical protein
MDDFGASGSKYVMLRQRCACLCGGEGQQAVLQCPVCSSLALVCNEVGSVFRFGANGPEPTGTTAYGHVWQTSEMCCPGCGQDVAMDYLGLNQCISLGLKETDLEVWNAPVDPAALLKVVQAEIERKGAENFSGEDVIRLMQQLKH